MTDTTENDLGGSELVMLRSRNLALESELRDARETADRRHIQAELRNEALRRGIVDIDGLKLIDTSNLTVDNGGDVQGVAALVLHLKKEKPWLFTSGNSSSLATVPSSVPNGSKQAVDMTLQEWRAARAELVRRR